MIHTWSSDIMIIAALIHIILHWDWIKNITAKMFGKKKVKAVTSPATTITTSQTEL
jgi:predicted CDP-diglyceride synthetase/phosphatidate cytidylyltransferase